MQLNIVHDAADADVEVRLQERPETLANSLSYGTPQNKKNGVKIKDEELLHGTPQIFCLNLQD